MSGLIQDARFALRQLRKAPGFTITAVLTLALGIGANSAIFTLVHAVLMQNLPVRDPGMLVRVGDIDECCVEGGVPENYDYSIFAYDLYRHLRDNTPDFGQLAAVEAGFDSGSLTVRRGGAQAIAKSTSGELVSGNYFQMLGLNPEAGRLLGPADDAENAAPVAVMSYQFWQREYAMDPSVVGSTFVINTHPVTIIGITPPAFYGDRMRSIPANFYLPMSMEPMMVSSSLLHKHDSNWVYLLGRIKPGTQLVPLQEKMNASLRQWLSQLELYQSEDGKKALAKVHLVLSPGGIGIGDMQQEYSKGLYLLMWVSALVLLIACANIANLMLVRGMARRTETSIRVALGAQRKRLIRQMLTESVVLACLGGLAGLVVAYAGTRMLLSLAFPDSQYLPIHASPSLTVLTFAFGISLLTGLIFGIAPAWITSHTDPAEALRGSNRATKDRGSLLQRSLIVFQAALSLVLLVGAGLMSKSLSRLEHQDFGIESANRVVIHLSPDNAGYKPEQLETLYNDLEQRFQSLPGVERVGLSLYAPLDGNNWGDDVYIQGHPEPHLNDNVNASWVRVSPDFFAIVGQHILRGRDITAHDIPTSQPVAVVNKAFVKKFFKDGESPIGAHFGTYGMKSVGDYEIVGVVSNAKYNNVRQPWRPMYFRPLLQVSPSGSSNRAGETRSLYISTIMLQMKGPVEGLETQVRQTLAGINPNLTVITYDTFENQVHGQFNQERMVARLTVLFGLLALALASVGLYGVTAYTVARRTSEIGIRMALGAGRGKVVSMVLREAMLQAGIGLAIGLPVAWMCARFIQSQLYGVGGHDAVVLLMAILALAFSACAAGLIPAQRAASTDPVQALRTE